MASERRNPISMTTEEFKEERLKRMRENYLPNLVKGFKKEHGISLTGRKNVMHERETQNACMEWLALKKITHVRLAVNSSVIWRNGKMIRISSPMKGWPDVLAIVGPHGTAVGLEFKHKTKQSEDQIAVQQYIERANGRYFIIHSLEELEAAILPLLQ